MRPIVYGSPVDVALLMLPSGMWVVIRLIWRITPSTMYADHCRDSGAEVPYSNAWGPTRQSRVILRAVRTDASFRCQRLFVTAPARRGIIQDGEWWRRALPCMAWVKAPTLPPRQPGTDVLLPCA